MTRKTKIEFGDFQTPPGLAARVCKLLRRLGVGGDVILEPTCGIGGFLNEAAAAFPDARLRGFEINAAYAEECRRLLLKNSVSRANVYIQDFFTHDWAEEISAHHGEVLLLGNPPWVTNSTISGIGGGNLPVKSNISGLRGIEAKMGKSNFDISEWMLIRLLAALRGRRACLAMLCKMATARKVLCHAWRNDGRISSAALYRIDAKVEFNAAVEACLFVVRTGDTGDFVADVYPSLDANIPDSSLGLIGDDLVSDIRTYRTFAHFEGSGPYRWRSGVKHDCSGVMELECTGLEGEFINKSGEHIRIEDSHVFPLLKCTDLARHRFDGKRALIVTQRRMGEDTCRLESEAPLLWRYLIGHGAAFTARKSSIYKNKPPFSVFGVGDYTFSPWKVAVSALHHCHRFVVVGPLEGKPVVFDDTCYFLSFESEAEARAVCAILDSDPCRKFLSALVFNDAKRPITTDLLHRLNLSAIADAAGLKKQWESVFNNSAKSNHSLPGQMMMIMESLEKPSRGKLLRSKSA